MRDNDIRIHYDTYILSFHVVYLIDEVCQSMRHLYNTIKFWDSLRDKVTLIDVFAVVLTFLVFDLSIIPGMCIVMSWVHLYKFIVLLLLICI